MDRFKISGPELCQFYSDVTPLSKVFGDIERELKEKSQVVCQFIVNGMALREEDETKFSVVPLKDVRSLEYLTESTTKLVGGVIEGWIGALPELIKNTEALSADIKKNGISARLRDVRDLIDNSQFLINSIISLKTVLGDTVMAAVQQWEEAENWTQKSMSEAVTAFEKKDFVQLADVFDYDLNRGLQLWLEILIGVQAVYTGKPIPPKTRIDADSVDRKRLSN